MLTFFAGGRASDRAEQKPPRRDLQIGSREDQTPGNLERPRAHLPEQATPD